MIMGTLGTLSNPQPSFSDPCNHKLSFKLQLHPMFPGTNGEFERDWAIIDTNTTICGGLGTSTRESARHCHAFTGWKQI